MHNRFVANNNTSNKNKKAADYDGASSLQDYQEHFEMITEINGWDNATKALEQQVLEDQHRQLSVTLDQIKEETTIIW